MLPITTVATVFPEHGAVVLNVDRRTLKGTSAAPTAVGNTPVGDRPSAHQDGSEEAWQTRITRYVGAGEGDANAAKAAAGGEQPGAEEVERLRTTDPVSPAERHLLFVSTSHGYELIERQGPAPAAFAYVPVPEHDGKFRVAKVAGSPLPNDRRVCAYLERTE